MCPSAGPEDKWESRGTAPFTLNLGTRMRVWSASCVGNFNATPPTSPPQVTILSSHSVGGRIGPKHGFDAVERRKTLVFAKNRNKIPWSSYPWPSHYTNTATSVPLCYSGVQAEFARRRHQRHS
jgi:hypothetical protein